MKIMIAQLNPKIGDLEGNTQKVIEALDFARKHGIKIVCFPEMTICGYAPDDLLLIPSFIDDMEKELDVIVRASKGLTAIVGLVRRNSSHEEKMLLNSAAVVSDGKLLGFHDKWLLPTYDVFNERRYFSRGKNLQVWNIEGLRIGVLICEDMWQNAGEEVCGTTYPFDPVKELKVYKPDILFNTTASPYQPNKLGVRIQVCQAAAHTLDCPIVYACQVGANGGIVFDGHSLFVDKDGGLRQMAEGFKEDYMVIDLDKKKEVMPFEHDGMQDLLMALKLGVSDYFKKASQKRAVIAISGGIDSAVVAVIAKEALGAENVTGIFMSTRFSSKESLEDAKALAQNLGIGFKEIDVDPLFENYLQVLGPHLQKNVEKDVTQENIQSRIRGNVLMAFSNNFQALALCTGNKSELALGYCTLYGDMCGAIAVIGDLLKTEVYRLAYYINRDKEVIPNRILEKPPSAELRFDQKDTDDLPPYEIVDQVIQEYVEENHTIEKIAKTTQIPLETVRFVVRRIHRAEHKRRQAPMPIRVSKKSLKDGRKKPIHSSGDEKVY